MSIKTFWATFESWVHSWFPGAKTYLTTGIGAVSSFAALAYQYIQGLPATKYISQETLTLTSAILFTLSFWFHNLGDRVQAREETAVAAAPTETPSA